MGGETFINDQGLKIEYSKPSLSCFYDKEAYEGYLNTCLMLPNYEACGQAKYEMHICGNKRTHQAIKRKIKIIYFICPHNCLRVN